MFRPNNTQSVEEPKVESQQDTWELDNDQYEEAQDADLVLVTSDDAKSQPGPAGQIPPVAVKANLSVEALSKSATPVPLSSPKAAVVNSPVSVEPTRVEPAPVNETKHVAPVAFDQPKEPAALAFTANDLKNMQELELTADSVKLLIEKFKFTSAQAALDFYSETSKWDYKFAPIQETLKELGCVATEYEAKALNANTTDYFLSLWFLIVRDGVKPDQAKQELRSAIAANEDRWKGFFTDKPTITFKKCGLFAMGLKKEKWEHISYDQVQIINTNGPEFGKKSLKDRIATVNDWIAKKSKDNDAKQDNRPASPKPTVPASPAGVEPSSHWGTDRLSPAEVDPSSGWRDTPEWPMVGGHGRQQQLYNPRDDFHFRNRTNLLVMKSRHHVYVVKDEQHGHHHSIKIYRAKRP